MEQLKGELQSCDVPVTLANRSVGVPENRLCLGRAAEPFTGLSPAGGTAASTAKPRVLVAQTAGTIPANSGYNRAVKSSESLDGLSIQ